MISWTPGEVHEYDQALAAADTELDHLVRLLKAATGEFGEQQGVADVGLYLLRERNHAALAGLLTAALRRLAAKETRQ